MTHAFADDLPSALDCLGLGAGKVRKVATLWIEDGRRTTIANVEKIVLHVALAPVPSSRLPMLFASLHHDTHVVGLAKKEAVVDFAGRIDGVARRVDDRHIRATSTELLSYVPAITLSGELDVREHHIDA